MNCGNSLANLGCLLANAASLHFLSLIFVRDLQDPQDMSGMLIWWGTLCLLYVGLWLLLQRTRIGVRGTVVWVAVCAAVQILATRLYGAGADLRLINWLWNVLLWGVTYYRGCALLLEPSQPEARMLDFETTVMALFVAAALVSGGAYGTGVLVPLTMGVAFALMGMAVQRASRGQNRPPLWLVAIPLGATGLGVLLVAVLSEPLGRLLKMAVNAVVWLVRWLGWAMVAAIEWLLSLFPAMETGEVELPPPTPAFQMTMAEEGADVLGGVNIIMLAAVLIIGAGAIFWLLRAPRKPLGNARAGKVRGLKFRQWLKALLGKLRAELRFWRRYLVARNTAPGLLLWLERRLQRCGKGRRKGETCRAFLQRAAELLPAQAEPLAELAGTIDGYYYGGTGAVFPASRVRSLRRGLQREIAALPILPRIGKKKGE